MNLKDLIVKYMKNTSNDDNNQKAQVPKSANKKVNEDSNSSINKTFMKINNPMDNKTKNLKSSKPNTRPIDNKDFQNIIQRQVKSGKKLLDDGIADTFRETKKNDNINKNMV
jgi:hypothetical protein